MATSISTIGAGSMDASDLETRFTLIQAWLNGGMVAGDLATDSWLGPEHIVAPEFFGTPAPMVRMAFGDVHWRVRSQDFSDAFHLHPEFRQADGNNWLPVDGLTATVDVDETSDIKVTASFWAWSNEGLSTSASSVDSTEIARFRMARFNESDGTLTSEANTARSLYGSGQSTSGAINSRIASKQFFMNHYMLNVAAGIHHIGVRCKLMNSTQNHYSNLFVVARNLNIRIFPKAS